MVGEVVFDETILWNAAPPCTKMIRDESLGLNLRGNMKELCV